ncbi:MAG: hypothetical protein LUF85_08635 [Bacteroides sp.]|nr:hypothetical protein [Bacteroides sp.]
MGKEKKSKINFNVIGDNNTQSGVFGNNIQFPSSPKYGSQKIITEKGIEIHGKSEPDIENIQLITRIEYLESENRRLLEIIDSKNEIIRLLKDKINSLK